MADMSKAVRKGLMAHVGERKVTDQDIERLLRIPIRRISLYDRSRAEKNRLELETELASLQEQLADVSRVAIRFIERLKRKYRKAYPRRTQIEVFGEVEKREIARRDLKFRFDKKTGYIGHALDTGEVLFELSSYDPVLVIRKDGSYVVSEAPEKLHAGNDMLYCGIVSLYAVFTVVYTDPFDETFIKRCKLGTYALNRNYRIVPDHCWVGIVTCELESVVHLSYAPAPRLRKRQESFSIQDYPIRSIKAGGIRLSTKEIEDCR